MIICMTVSQAVMAYNCTSTNYANSFTANEHGIKENFSKVLVGVADLWLSENNETYSSINSLNVKMNNISNGLVILLTGEFSFTTSTSKVVSVSYLSIPLLIMPIAVGEQAYCGLGPFENVSSIFDVRIDGESLPKTYFVETPHSELSIPLN
jgi:hypothetical protein